MSLSSVVDIIGAGLVKIRHVDSKNRGGACLDLILSLSVAKEKIQKKCRTNTRGLGEDVCVFFF